MATLVATPLPVYGIVKVIADFQPAQLDGVMHLYRVTPDGAEHEVIGSPVRLSGGQAILYDSSAPFDVNLTYRAVLENPAVLRDDFDRSVTNGWGISTSGHTWTTDNGPTSIPQVFANVGVHRIAAVSTLSRNAVAITPTADIDARVTMLLGLVPTGDYIRTDFAIRYVDANNYYMLRTRVFPNSSVDVQLVKVLAGSESTLASVNIPSLFVANQSLRLEVQAVSTTLKARVWRDGTVMPDWQLTAVDTSHGAGRMSIGTYFPSANTNGLPYNVVYDEIYAYSPTSSSLSTAAPIQLAAGRDGWIRDPQDPTRSVRLDNCASHTFACLTSPGRFVFFQGMEEEQYDSATGVFGVINSERPVTVAQTRKGLSTALRIVSTTLADIPALRDLFSTGRDLVLSLPTDYGWGIETYGTEPVSVGDVSVSRLNKRDLRKPQRLWGLPLVVVDADETYPDGMTGSNGIPAPGATFGDLKALNWTFGQLAGSGFTDTFTRTTSSGWGGTWSMRSGVTAQQSTTGASARMSQTDRSGPDFGTFTVMEVPMSHTDVDVKVRFQWAVLAAGDAQRASIIFRETDRNNWLRMEATFLSAAGGTQFRFSKAVSGTKTFDTPVTVSGLTQTLGVWYWLRLRAVGTSIQAKLWADGTTEPGTWGFTKTEASNPSGAWIGVEGFAGAFSTNPTPEILDWDDFQVSMVGSSGGRTFLDWAQGVFT